MGISRTTCQYQTKPKDDQDLQEALTVLTTKHASIGFGIRVISGIIREFAEFKLT